MPSKVVHQLDSEWKRAVEIHRLEPAFWASQCPHLETCLTLDDVLGCVSAAPDPVLAFLVGRAVAGDEVATRTVLQTMLGKLVLMAGTGVARQQSHALDDLVGHMWLRIKTYPLSTRPQRIAANLALDTLKAALRDWRTTDSSIEVSAPPNLVDETLDSRSLDALGDEFSPSTEALLGTAHRLGLISQTTHDVLVAVYGPEELSGQRAAERWNCSPQAIRSRCSRAVRDLAPHARLLVATAA